VPEGGAEGEGGEEVGEVGEENKEQESVVPDLSSVLPWGFQ
jgi:hypothetical protein